MLRGFFERRDIDMSKKKRIEEEAEKAKAAEVTVKTEVSAKKAEPKATAASEKATEAKPAKKTKSESAGSAKTPKPKEPTKSESEALAAMGGGERNLKPMTTKQLTEAMYEFAVRVFEWQQTADSEIECHGKTLKDHEKRLAKLEESQIRQSPKPEPKPEPEPEPKPEPEPESKSPVKVQPLVNRDDGNRFPFADGPCDQLWLWYSAKRKTWCGPTDVNTACRLSAKTPVKAYVWIKNGKATPMTEEEIAEYFG